MHIHEFSAEGANGTPARVVLAPYSQPACLAMSLLRPPKTPHLKVLLPPAASTDHPVRLRRPPGVSPGNLASALL